MLTYRMATDIMRREIGYHHLARVMGKTPGYLLHCRMAGIKEPRGWKEAMLVLVADRIADLRDLEMQLQIDHDGREYKGK